MTADLGAQRLDRTGQATLFIATRSNPAEALYESSH
jgi:hypothetical protein